MTGLTHIVECSSPELLPFARSRIKALRATGLTHASQKFDVSGVTVAVRIAGEHSYISVSGDLGRVWMLIRRLEQIVDSHGTSSLFVDDGLLPSFADPSAYMCEVDAGVTSTAAVYRLNLKSPENAKRAKRVHAGSTGSWYTRKITATDGPNFHYSYTAITHTNQFGDVSGMLPYGGKVLLWRNGATETTTVYIPWVEGNGYFYTDVVQTKTRNTTFSYGSTSSKTTVEDLFQYGYERRGTGVVNAGQQVYTFSHGPLGAFTGDRIELYGMGVFSATPVDPAVDLTKKPNVFGAAGPSPGTVMYSAQISLTSPPKVVTSTEVYTPPIIHPLTSRTDEDPEYTYAEIGGLTQGHDFIYIKNGDADARLYDRRMRVIHTPVTAGAVISKEERFVCVPAVAASGDVPAKPWGFTRCLNSWGVEGVGVDVHVGGVLSLADLPGLPPPIAELVASLTSMHTDDQTTSFSGQVGSAVLTVQFLTDQKIFAPTFPGVV